MRNISDTRSGSRIVDRSSTPIVIGGSRPSPSCGIGSLRANSSRARSEEHTSELQSHSDLVCRLLLEKKKKRELPGATVTLAKTQAHVTPVHTTSQHTD